MLNVSATLVFHQQQIQQTYFTFLPKADKIIWDFRDDVAIVVGDGAVADFWMGTEYLLTQLL